ncbi:lipopolysaccharide biosynthesis protein [Synechocystis sp. CACIAM 05]|uniref:lipopolysaccharide biosynthesis protein n=1 Tax=Synechocystis sp. CACIAM 05 TaxID=1933929 RepID=UPI00138E7D06|nr:lipopolysaccharide biosynthesis protein [Synechocystis sp. CACIAM 05]QHU98996.1 hypothetical protein BWK47_01835 [Synechocystis sp. CACIAM 05]
MQEKSNTFRQQRNLKFKINVGIALVGKVIATIISLVRVPILINYLNPEGYGLFITITSVANWIQLGQLGMGSGLINALIKCDAEDDKASAQKYVNSLWLGLAIALLILSLFLFGSFPFTPWNKLFPIDDAQLAIQVPQTVAFTLITVLFGIFMTPLGSIYNAYQEQYKLNLWSNLQGIVGLGAVVLATQLQSNMADISLAIGLATLLVNGANYFCLIKWDKPYLKFDVKTLSVSAFKGVWSSSISFFLIEVSALLVFQTDRFLILQFSNSVEVTKYTLASTVYLTFHGIYFLFLKPLWPAFGEAIHRGDIVWTRRVFNKVNLLSSIGMMLLIAVVLMAGPYLIELWTGRSDVEPDKLLLAILGFYFLIRVFTDVHSIVIFSLNKQKELLLATVSHGFLNLVLGIVLGREYGVHGIALASLLSFALSSGWWIPYKTRYFLRKLGEPSNQNH